MKSSSSAPPPLVSMLIPEAEDTSLETTNIEFVT